MRVLIPSTAVNLAIQGFGSHEVKQNRNDFVQIPRRIFIFNRDISGLVFNNNNNNIYCNNHPTHHRRSVSPQLPVAGYCLKLHILYLPCIPAIFEDFLMKINTAPSKTVYYLWFGSSWEFPPAVCLVLAVWLLRPLLWEHETPQQFLRWWVLNKPAIQNVFVISSLSNFSITIKY